MAIEQEIQEVLNDHNSRITKLETDTAVIKEQLNNVLNKQDSHELALNRVENTVLSMSNSILSAFNSITNNNSNNNTKIIMKVLGVISLMIASFMAAKYGIKIAP